MPFLKHHGVMLNYADHGSFKLDGRWFPVMDMEVTTPISRGKADDKPKPKAHQANRADGLMRMNKSYKGAMKPKGGRDVKVGPDKHAH
jgi:hypothetical protein